MSDENAYMISDIDDSEGEELYGEYKQDTINVPDQATNSDAFLDFHKLRAKKSDSAVPENEKSIFNEKNEKNNNEENEIPNNDYFTYQSEEDKEEEKQKSEDIFTTKSDINDEENEIPNNDYFTYQSEEDKEEEKQKSEDTFTTKSDINDEENEKSEEEEEYIDEGYYSENYENDEKSNEYEEEDNYSDECYQNDGNYIEEDSESNDLSEENTETSDYSVSEKENYSEKKNTSNTIYNYNDSNFNADDEKTDQNEEKEDAINEFYNEEQNCDKTESDNSNRIQNKPDDIENNIYESVNFADESNNFTEESNTNFNDSKKLSSDENKTKDEPESNKEDSIKNPISEPKQKRNEPSHRHNPRNKKKEKEEEKQKENNQKQTNKQISKNKKNNESSSQKVHSNYTIDEITDISINNGDFSLLNQSNIEKVMSKMRQKQREALQAGDYDLAEKYQLATQSGIRYFNEKQLLKHSSNRACEINVQLEQTRNDISFLEEHWAQVIENAKQKANDDLLQLRNEQDKKVKDFDAEYKKIISDPEQNLPLEYKKYSSKVLALRKKQEVFINTNNFKMAKEINKEIKKLEEKEKNENILRFQKKKTAERNHMIKKQDEIFAVRKENWFTTIEKIKNVAKSEIEHAKRSEKQLENKYIQNNEFSNKILKQQQQMKKDKQMQLQSNSNSPSEDTKTVTHTQFTIQRNAQKVLAQEFRERAMINRIIYTNKAVPKVKKPVPSPRNKSQYARSPR